MTVTKQDLFNKMWAGLRAQNWKRSGYEIDGIFRCAYFGPDGCRCAFGHLLPDELKDNPICKPEADLAAFAVVVKIPWLSGQLNWDENQDLVNYMQVAHDNLSEHGIEARVREAARRFGLTIPEEV